MIKLKILLAICVSNTMVMFSCKSNQAITERNPDSMYFMASDVAPANQSNSFNFTQENFSERNINPEYIARYQTKINDVSETESKSNIQVYNYFGGGGQDFFNPMSGGFYPFGLGLYDPFWGGGWGLRPNVFIGRGWGFINPWLIGSNFGFTNFYDPFFNPFFPVFRPGLNGFYSGFGWNYDVYHRQTTRGARPTRGLSLDVSNRRQVNTLATPNGTRSAARENVLSNRTVNQGLPGTNTRENFRSSQNDYYNNTKSVTPSRRATQTPIVNRELNKSSGQNTRSFYKDVTPNTNALPSRRTSPPDYNRGAPIRNTPTYSAPSRNSGGSAGSTGTGTRRGN